MYLYTYIQYNVSCIYLYTHTYIYIHCFPSYTKADICRCISISSHKDLHYLFVWFCLQMHCTTLCVYTMVYLTNLLCMDI